MWHYGCSSSIDITPSHSLYTNFLKKTYSHSVDCCKKNVGVYFILSAFPCGETEKDCLNNQYKIQQSFSKHKGRERICWAPSFYIVDDKAQQGCV